MDLKFNLASELSDVFLVLKEILLLKLGLLQIAFVGCTLDQVLSLILMVLLELIHDLFEVF